MSAMFWDQLTDIFLLSFKTTVLSLIYMFAFYRLYNYPNRTCQTRNTIIIIEIVQYFKYLLKA